MNRAKTTLANFISWREIVRGSQYRPKMKKWQIKVSPVFLMFICQ